jgi:hypothetical protein
MDPMNANAELIERIISEFSGKVLKEKKFLHKRHYICVDSVNNKELMLDLRRQMVEEYKANEEDFENYEDYHLQIGVGYPHNWFPFAFTDESDYIIWTCDADKVFVLSAADGIFEQKSYRKLKIPLHRFVKKYIQIEPYPEKENQLGYLQGLDPAKWFFREYDDSAFNRPKFFDNTPSAATLAWGFFALKAVREGQLYWREDRVKDMIEELLVEEAKNLANNVSLKDVQRVEYFLQQLNALDKELLNELIDYFDYPNREEHYRKYALEPDFSKVHKQG